MIEGLDQPTCTEDRGADRDVSPKPCAKLTWCTLVHDHAGSCEVVPRSSHLTPDFGPKRTR